MTADSDEYTAPAEDVVMGLMDALAESVARAKAERRRVDPQKKAPSSISSGVVEDALDLSEREVAAVARRLLANQINLDDDWFSWEDYPKFSERTAMRLSDELDRLRKEAHREASRLDGCDDIDSIQLLDQARA